MNLHTVLVHHPEGVNTGNENSTSAENLSDEDLSSNSDETVTGDENNRDIEPEPSKFDGATNRNEIKVIGVTKLDNNDDKDTKNDDVLRISQQALTLTPIRQNTFVQANYWELIPSAAKKMSWKLSEIGRRCEGNSLFKSKDCNNAKSMLDSFHEMDENFINLGVPESIENEDQLIFIKMLHQKIASTEKTIKAPKKT